MNDRDIQALKDFIDDAIKEIDAHLQWQKAQSYTESYYEKLAAKYEVTVDYIMMEFIL